MKISDDTRRTILDQIELKKAMLREAERVRDETARLLAIAEAEAAAVASQLVGTSDDDPELFQTAAAPVAIH